MRLLLTRAAADAARTRDALEALGHRVLVSPVIEIVGTDAAWPAGVIDAVIATSGQAFAAPVAGLAPEARRLMPLFVVGERTANQARTHDFLGPATVAANATMLALAVGKHPDRLRRSLYLAGRDRKPDMETALTVIGHPPEVLEVYEAHRTAELSTGAACDIRDGLIGGILHFSRRSASLLLEQAAEAGIDVRPLIHFCLSDDVAEPLRGAGCAKTRTAEAPTEAALLELLPPA